jgi:cyclic beta-1,2-glucan synthetase
MAESVRHFDSPHHATPRTQLLSNGNYAVLLSAAGSGYSRYRDFAVTRWREDATCDPWGSYVFLRDVFNGQVWSAGYQPIGREPESYTVRFQEAAARIVRKDGPIITQLDVLVSSEDDVEVRRVSLTNQGRGAREIELTSYAELVLAPVAADAAHPAFSKMFVQTEFVAERGVLLATRRPRDAGETRLWLAHFSCMEGEGVGGLQFESDRARFLGRGHDVRTAVSVLDARPLSGTMGTVLDPIVSLRRRVRIEPGETVSVAFWTGVCATRAQALGLVDKHGDMPAFTRAQTLTCAQTEVRLREAAVSEPQAMLFQEIASRLVYADAALRAPAAVLAANRLGQNALWPHGLSGDSPIVLLEARTAADVAVLELLLGAQVFWHLKCLTVDIVVLDSSEPSSALHDRLNAALGHAAAPAGSALPCGARVLLREASLSHDERALFMTAARAVFGGARPAPAAMLAALDEAPQPPRQHREHAPDDAGEERPLRSIPPLEFFNGFGGFTDSGREYAVVLDDGQWTPAPWVNVIANPNFGFLSSADGCGSTWSLNAQQNQLTPWSNDPVSNSPAEAIYLRDEKSGDLWSATPLPIRERASTYVVRHGFGYTRTEHTVHGIALDLQQFVPLADPLKISRLKIHNLSQEPRQLSVSHYLDWVLGSQRARSAPFLVTEVDTQTGALLARSAWGSDFAGRVAFMDMGGRQQSLSGDRAEFIGRHGSLAEPAALLGLPALSNRVGAGLDPCGALQTKILLKAGETVELVFLLGQADSTAAAQELIARYRQTDLDAVLKSVIDFWDLTLGAVQVKTPDRSMDILLNGWLAYQTLACRVWARTGFYQSSGAYGFRDQLQDVMALCVAAPAVTREHLLRAAARQFSEGDVQHWWLPTSGAGVKTRVADDRIWLPFVAMRYIEVTADAAVLDEKVPFLGGGPLPPGQQESFSVPPTAESASLYEHCVRALDSSLSIGSHGLPLFGTGDWNDGMNRVGVQGLGESVWMGWFLHTTLLRFAEVAASRGQTEKAELWRKHAFALQQAIEREAWDGDWYRRGYYDDGTPLGSVANDECRIDSIAQSWAVISGGAERSRAVRAMAAVNAQLVSRSEGLVQLFTPAFDHSSHDPGYIKAYPPGLRENGGQYTHAALWVNLAYALLGDGDRAGEIFSLLNPINHASTRAGIHRYKVEPYVVCADVYSSSRHIGRGGWTWYTGSAGWMYRTALEAILGFQLRGTVLRIDPCIPRAWTGYEFTYKFGSSRYRIAIENPRGVSRGIAQASLDGQRLPDPGCEFALVDDGRYHYGQVTLG